MKSRLVALLILSLLPLVRAEDARFFRVAGPVASTITAVSPDGYVTWSNAPINATFTVQTATSLSNPNNWVDYIQVPVTNLVTTQRLYDPNPPSGMALIPAGSFMMGDTFSEGFSTELPLHTVYVTGLYMDKYEVTKALWDDVYQWATNHGYSFDNAGSSINGTNRSRGPDHPVYLINWYDMVKWCNARSEKEGRVPAYYTSVAHTMVYRSGQVNVQNDWVKWGAGYRLPTEAEWEKAARGGASGQRFPWGNTISHVQANYFADPSSYPYDVNPSKGFHPIFGSDTSPVGYFAANGYGLYDMAGNVFEWCWDWYGSYSSGSQTNPRGPTSSFGRVIRGASWGDVPHGCRVAFRLFYDPTAKASIGFRSVLPLAQ